MKKVASGIVDRSEYSIYLHIDFCTPVNMTYIKQNDRARNSADI